MMFASAFRSEENFGVQELDLKLVRISDGYFGSKSACMRLLDAGEPFYGWSCRHKTAVGHPEPARYRRRYRQGLVQ